ncbi:hypothetical protein QJS04_geneDACA005163 [Acorus gramineus]|uniref:Uncharacterized protein n=1 Tax=Acorus gramineus TaxID=55184 RepID=A0AAV9AYW6_ACOGR|nr:hypothetical protein QJS04_geneDACA005163 [Acorus gramineus]
MTKGPSIIKRQGNPKMASEGYALFSPSFFFVNITSHYGRVDATDGQKRLERIDQLMMIKVRDKPHHREDFQALKGQ